ncbi:DUF4255 domain-containing protein [Streptomyces sp. p1417]|uniref:DUF4255 domain-containing protein n=1 Tax=Streptomyces typhae TaxID=2681492 RepID=A0A6L6WV14_9ACTN|nr:DUF4255 domain-containing protein [Streptomyces typhae]
MIHEVDEVLKGLVGGGALADSGIDVSFDVPSRDWAARRNAPVVNAYLYDIREDVTRRQRGHIELRDGDAPDATGDTAVRRRRPPRWFRLSYLVTAWTKTPQDEHRLLSAVLATLLPHELLSAAELPDALGRLGLSVPMTVASNQSEARSLADIWSALGGELKPSLDVVLTVPFPAHPDYDAGPPVTEGATVRVRGVDGGPPRSEERSHRPHQVAAARAARTQSNQGPAAARRTPSDHGPAVARRTEQP